MKTIVSTRPISSFRFVSPECKERTEIEYYSDGTYSTVFAIYTVK